MTEHRPIMTLEAELEAAEDALAEAKQRRDRLRSELNAARVAGATHPLLGKKVERFVPARFRSRNHKGTTQRGTVVVYDRGIHYGVKGLSWYGLKPGDIVVVHESGRTGWDITPERGAEWQPVEESGK